MGVLVGGRRGRGYVEHMSRARSIWCLVIFFAVMIVIGKFLKWAQDNWGAWFLGTVIVGTMILGFAYDFIDQRRKAAPTLPLRERPDWSKEHSREAPLDHERLY
jgi:hypothetical protein